MSEDQKQIKKVSLSATTLDIIDTCSWIYYNKILLKVPEKEGIALARGNIAHEILELLAKDKHKSTAIKLINSPKISPLLWRIVKRKCEKRGITDEEELDLISSFVKVGLNTDFYCQNAPKIQAERPFKFEGDGFVFRGKIDKTAFHSDKDISIIDYKTSKSKFSGEKINSNIQALAYSLQTFQEFNVIPSVYFIFLRHAKNPMVAAPIPKEKQLHGFRYYLEELSSNIKNFDLEMAKSKFAKDSVEKRWLCKKGSWVCAFMNPFDYYALVKDGKLVKTSQNRATLDLEAAKNGGTVEKRHYGGCPAWLEKSEKENGDFF